MVAALLITMSHVLLGAPASEELAPPVRLEAAGKPIDTDVGHAAPWVCDINGDGLNDLLVGCGDGSVSFFRNQGSATPPKLAEAEILVPAGERFRERTGIHRGSRAKVCAADWNGDGRLDLLLGDFYTEKLVYPDLTDEEKAEHARIRKELEPLQERRSELIDKLYLSGEVKDKKEKKKLHKEFAELAEKTQELREKLPAERAYHGSVWLFPRK